MKMQLTEKQLNDFKELYYKQFWIELNNADALEYWLKLVNLVKIVTENNENKD